MKAIQDRFNYLFRSTKGLILVAVALIAIVTVDCGVDLERVALFTMAAATLGSALFGAVLESPWGRGQETFLAEDIVRMPFKAPLQLVVIGHLHIWRQAGRYYTGGLLQRPGV